MISATQNEDTFVAMHPVDLVQEIASELVSHQTVEILQDEKAGGGFPGLLEYLGY